MRESGIIMAGALLLGGCAPRQDDPSNPARLGRWEDRTILTGVRLNDRALKDEEIPPELRGMIAQFNSEKSVCGEPFMREESEMQSMLEMIVRVDGRIGPEQLRLDVDGIARLTEKTGGNYVVVVSGRREITRVGDC